MKKIILFSAIITTIFFGAFYGCKKSSSSTGPRNIDGIVLSESGAPLASAIITCDGMSATSNSDGTFTLGTKTSSTVYYVTVIYPGCFPSYKAVQNVNGSAMNVQIYMLNANVIGTIPGSGGAVSGSNFRITASGTSFYTASGTPYTGAVTATARYISQDDSNINNYMPGGDFTAEDAGGNKGILRTFGFVATQFTDASGNILTANQSTVKITITPPTGHYTTYRGCASLGL